MILKRRLSRLTVSVLTVSALLGMAAIASFPLLLITSPQALAVAVTGQGIFKFQGRLPEQITSINYGRTSNNSSTLVMMLSGGRSITLRGTAAPPSAGSTKMQVRGVGQTAASGTLTINFANGEVKTVVGNGLIDGQRFSMDFDRIRSRSSSDGAAAQGRLTLLQQGTGTYSLAGENSAIQRASIEVRGDAAEIAFRLTDDRLTQLDGTIIKRGPYSLVIRLTHSGDTEASGTANVSYAQGKSISSIVIDGSIDGQDLLVDFSRQ